MELTFERLMSLFQKKLKYILIASLIAAIGAYFISANAIKKEYTSNSTLLIMMNAATTQSGVNELNVTQNIVGNYILTLNTDNFFKIVSNSLNEEFGEDFNYATIRSRTAIEGFYTEENSGLSIRYTCGDKASAQLILEVINKEATDYINKLGFPNELLTIDDPTLPTSPSSPNTKTNAAYAFIIVFVICVCIIYFKEIFDDRIKSTHDISKYNFKILGIIPDYTQKPTFNMKRKNSYRESEGAKK